MKTLYELLIEEVTEGKSFNIDLNSKSLRIGNKYYIKDGERKEDIPLIKADCSWVEVKKLWSNFQRSVPNISYKNHYFKGADESELDDYELIHNDRRYLAQVKLEGYILLASMQKTLLWEDPGKYFYQDGDMFILREWIIQTYTDVAVEDTV